MKKFTLIVAIVFTLAWLVLLAVFQYTSWRLEQDIDGWKNRAQVASDPSDMLDYLTNLKVGLEKWGMTSGHAALVFHTPNNNMEEIYDTVVNNIERAKELTAMDPLTDAFVSGLDDRRGALRELELHSYKYWSVHQGLVFEILAVFSAVIAVIFWIWRFSLSERYGY